MADANKMEQESIRIPLKTLKQLKRSAGRRGARMSSRGLVIDAISQYLHSLDVVPELTVNNGAIRKQ